jgi:hypothetical protein
MPDFKIEFWILGCIFLAKDLTSSVDEVQAFESYNSVKEREWLIGPQDTHSSCPKGV